MTLVRRCTPALLLGLIVASVLTVVSVQSLPSPSLRPAADTSKFQAGNIISDAVFYDSGAMSAAQIQSFLNGKGGALRAYRVSSASRAADSRCRAYKGGTNELASLVIAKVAAACGINPRVLLVTLQKEEGLVTNTSPSSGNYRIAMGYGCPDTAKCDTQYYGFANQLYSAAHQFRSYALNPTSYSYRAGVTRNVAFYPLNLKPKCGSGSVYFQNQATASLYNYTPYQPNAAALRAGYGTGDGCSSYGNRNFWLYFTDWFGTTYSTSRDVDAPKGHYDSAVGKWGTVTVKGWAFDPNVPTQATTVQVLIDGKLVKTLTANVSRPDVAKAYASLNVGPAHGFSATLPAAPGQRSVCITAINVGAGYTNPSLGCKTVTVIDPALPMGYLDSATATGTTVTINGWTFDRDAPTAPVTVHVYVDGTWVADVVADQSRPDVGQHYPTAGDQHGYVWSGIFAAGTHQVCTYGVNLGAGTGDGPLGCRSVTMSEALSAAPVSPRGRLDSVAAVGTTVTAWGWAYDPDASSAQLTVHVYVDGKKIADTVANTSRPDVARAYPGAGGSHGYLWSATLPAGTHKVCTYAVNQGPVAAVPQLGCRSVTVAGSASAAASNPRGRLDSVTAIGTRVTAWGWAFDPDVPPMQVPVGIYVDGKRITSTTANTARPDVATVYPAAGSSHGYLWWGTLPAGKHQVCTYATNQGPGTGRSQLGCRSVTVAGSAPAAASNPLGRLDTVSASGSTATVWGWAFDPDVPRLQIPVGIYVDGTRVTLTTANTSRPDVGRVYPSAGSAHGYLWRGRVSAGTHQVCSYGANQGPGTGNPRLGCKTLVVR